MVMASSVPIALRLVSMVAAHDGGEACVCDLTEPLGLTQPTVSHHLKILVEAGIFTRDKRGVWAYYASSPPPSTPSPHPEHRPIARGRGYPAWRIPGKRPGPPSRWLLTLADQA
jgi:DNA-binding transcriptional ArsR family regulator